MSQLEFGRIVCDVEPRPASTAVEPDTAGLPLPPSVWTKSLKGELDAILRMAMRREPSQRYPTVAHLAADIRAYLEGRAVVARGEG
ncbi:MAG: hypothetical protein JNK87_24210 [Bryobacterales bacterium]|nr:hypothetical protein [Bryobacterales bacterium]